MVATVPYNTISTYLKNKGINFEWRADGKVFAELPLLDISADGMTTGTSWTEVPTDYDEFLEWVGFGS